MGARVGLGTDEIMSQHFHIWRDKQTIQGSCQTCIYGKTSKIKIKPCLGTKDKKTKIHITQKTLRWISSKVTPADASRTCASFRI